MADEKGLLKKSYLVMNEVTGQIYAETKKESQAWDIINNQKLKSFIIVPQKIYVF